MRIPDPEALLAHDGYVRALARHLVADSNRVEDLAQQTWIVALEHAPREPGAMRAWLAAIVRNLASKLAREEARRSAREKRAARPEAVASAEEIVACKEAWRRLVNAVADLEEPYRSTMALRYFEDLPLAVIARRLDVPVATVSTRVSRGLDRLRARFDREHAGDRAAWCLALAPLVNLPPTAPAGAPAGVGEAALSRVLSLSTKAKVGAAAALLLGVSVAVWVVSRPAKRQEEGVIVLGPEMPPGPAEAGLPNPEPASSPPAREAVRVAEASARVPPEPYGSLLVRVTWGEDGTPAANFGARVYAWGEANPYFLNMDPGAVTGADGTFRIDRIRAGRVSVELERGTGGAIGETTVEPGRQAELSLVVPPGYEVTGSVVDPDGRPVPGAGIWLSSEGQQAHGRVVDLAGVDGRFRVRSMRGLHWIGARAPGYAPSPLQGVEPTRGRTSNLRLTLAGPGGEVEGRVFDPAGRPVEGAAVEVGAGDYRILPFSDGTTGSPPPPIRLRTDSDGRFLARGVRPGTVPITVRSYPHAVWMGTVQVAPNGTASVEALLGEGVTLEGRVLDARWRPVSGVEVFIGYGFGFASSYVRTGADGSFRLEGLGIGEWSAIADGGKRGIASASFVARPGERLRWDALLSTRSEIRGRVLDEAGAPLVGWSISAYPADPAVKGRPPARGVTEADGSFTLRDCRDVAHHLEVRVPRIGLLGAAVDDARPAPPELLITVPASALPSAYLTGTVVGADGRPLGGVTVTPSNHEFAQSPPATTEKGTGRFDVGPVPPGIWGLRFRAAGLPEVRTEPRRLGRGETWDVGAVRMEEGGRLVVFVERDAQIPGRSPVLTLSTLDEPLPFDGSAARSGPIAPGNHLLQVGGRGIASALVPFAIRSGEETRLSVVLRPGFERRVRLPTPAGDRRANSARVVVRDEAGTVVFDQFVWRMGGSPFELELGLGPGVYSVEGTAYPDRRASGVIRVEGAAPAEVEIPMG